MLGLMEGEMTKWTDEKIDTWREKRTAEGRERVAGRDKNIYGK
jgi:hypothetical protein